YTDLRRGRILSLRPPTPQPPFRFLSHGFVAEFSQHFILAHKFLLKARDIFEQTLGRQPQKIESELRVLKIKLFDLLIAGGKDLSVFHALDGLSATIIWRQKSQVSENLTGRELDSHFPETIPTAHAVIHCVGRIPLIKYNVPFAKTAPSHERLEPIDRGFAIGRRGLHVLN